MWPKRGQLTLFTEKAMAPHSSTLAWRIPGTGEPGALPSMGSQSRTRLKWLSSCSNLVQETATESAHNYTCINYTYSTNTTTVQNWLKLYIFLHFFHSICLHFLQSNKLTAQKKIKLVLKWFNRNSYSIKTRLKKVIKKDKSKHTQRIS